MSQCESYLRLARDGVAQQTDVVPDNIDVDSLISDGDDDKVYGAMGVAKTIGTVGLFLVLHGVVYNTSGTGRVFDRVFPRYFETSAGSHHSYHPLHIRE